MRNPIRARMSESVPIAPSGIEPDMRRQRPLSEVIDYFAHFVAGGHYSTDAEQCGHRSSVKNLSDSCTSYVRYDR